MRGRRSPRVGRTRRANSTSLGPSFLDRSDTLGKIWVASRPGTTSRPIRSRHFLALRFRPGPRSRVGILFFDERFGKISRPPDRVSISGRRHSSPSESDRRPRVGACPSARSSRPREPSRARLESTAPSFAATLLRLPPQRPPALLRHPERALRRACAHTAPPPPPPEARACTSCATRSVPWRTPPSS